MFGLSPSSPTRKYWQDVQVGKIMAIARASPKIAQQRDQAWQANKSWCQSKQYPKIMVVSHDQYTDKASLLQSKQTLSNTFPILRKTRTPNKFLVVI
jgi:hypothetical protein